MRRVVIVMLLGVVITLGGVIVLAKDDKGGANGSGVPEPYHHAMTTPAETLTDPQLVKANNDLKAYNVSLQQSVADLTTQRNLAQADATKAQGEATNLQAQLDELTADKTTLQGQYDDLFARYDDGPKYDLQLKRERFIWLVLLGGLVTLAGLVLSFYLQPRRLWAEQTEAGWTVHGESRKGGALFRDRLREAAGENGQQPGAAR